MSNPEGADVTRIRATCPDCGEVDLRPADIHLEIVRSDVGDVGDGSTYRFACPDCTKIVTKPADDRIARLLETGGVESTETAGAAHPEQPPAGPPLDYDDLLAFHELLTRDDWFAELQASIS